MCPDWREFKSPLGHFAVVRGVKAGEFDYPTRLTS
jgi:hypothetical protein